MKKYFTLFSQSFSQALSYRLQVVLNIFQSFLTPLFMLLALSSAKALGVISINQLIPYYLLIALVYPVVKSDIDENINEMNVSGEVNNFLLKPISFYRFLMVKDFSERLVTFLTVLPLFLIIYVLIGFHYPLVLNPIIAICLLLSFYLSFSFSYLVGLLCFWIDEFWAIHNLKYVVVQFLGGVVLPYTFFPDWLYHFLQYSPFPYMVSWVPRILQGKFSSWELVVVLIWLGFFRVSIKFFEDLAIHQYSFTAN